MYGRNKNPFRTGKCIHEQFFYIFTPEIEGVGWRTKVQVDED
jgi:hypothetical protein